ncbi:MAG: cupin domain-containing protein [Candidatus Geothermarchaeales archaeon]
MVVKDSSKIAFFSMVPQSRGKVIAVGKNMTMLYGEFEPGVEFPEHSHPHEQIGYVLEGKCELKLEGKTYIVEEGYTYSIPSHAKHGWKNVGKEKFAWIDIFYPVREDLLQRRFDKEKWEVKP